MPEDINYSADPGRIVKHHYEDYQMFLRDQFAKAAMQGMCANPSMVDGITVQSLIYLTDSAYCIADAMLKQREINKTEK